MLFNKLSTWRMSRGQIDTETQTRDPAGRTWHLGIYLYLLDINFIFMFIYFTVVEMKEKKQRRGN